MQDLARSLGVQLADLFTTHVFVIRTANLQYKKSLALGDSCVVVSRIQSVSPVRLFWRQDMLCCDERSVVCTAELEVATLNKSMKPCRHPSWINNYLKEIEFVH